MKTTAAATETVATVEAPAAIRGHAKLVGAVEFGMVRRAILKRALIASVPACPVEPSRPWQKPPVFHTIDP
jgi:hypothetical protein